MNESTEAMIVALCLLLLGAAAGVYLSIGAMP
jgi:hypothetical protein